MSGLSIRVSKYIFWSFCNTSGLKYNIKTCIPICLTNDAGHPHSPRLVVYHSTCRPLSSSSPREQLCNRSCSNKHTHSRSKEHSWKDPSRRRPKLANDANTSAHRRSRLNLVAGSCSHFNRHSRYGSRTAGLPAAPIKTRRPSCIRRFCQCRHVLGNELPCCCVCLGCGVRCLVQSRGHIGRSRRGRRHLDRAQPAPAQGRLRFICVLQGPGANQAKQLSYQKQS